MGERDFVGYADAPPKPQWPGGARLALNVVINVEEGAEPSPADGDDRAERALTEALRDPGFEGRDLAAESMFAYGARVGVWRLRRLLAERRMAHTVFVCARALERNRPLAEAIAADPWVDVCCHGFRWLLHAAMDEGTERAEICRAVASLRQTIGERPLGWYCRYGPSLNTRRLLVEEGGFLYDSDAYDDELPYWAEVSGRAHLVVPYSLTHNDTKFTAAVGTGKAFGTMLIEAFDMLYEEGAQAPKMMSVGLHPRLVGHPGRASGLRRFLDHVAATPDVWVTRRIDIARHWIATHPARGR